MHVVQTVALFICLVVEILATQRLMTLYEVMMLVCGFQDLGDFS